MIRSCGCWGSRTAGFGPSTHPWKETGTRLGFPSISHVSTDSTRATEFEVPRERATPGGRAWGGRCLGAGLRVGRYRLIEPLGAGGQTVVWRAALDGIPRREVALKLLAITSSARSRMGVTRLRREARRGERLASPFLLAISDFGTADGYAYLAMPLVEGGSLADALGQRHRPEGGHAPDDAIWLAAQPEAVYAHCVAGVMMRIARALQVAHDANVIHCDIKPANILMDRRCPDRVFLSDFGIGRDLDAVPPGYRRDLSGTMMYMAPEILRGRPSDGRLCDVYALGVTLFEAVTGVRPFRMDEASGHPLESLVRIAAQEPLRPRAVAPRMSRRMAEIIERAMARRPARRYPRASALADELERFVEGRHVG